MLVRELLKEIVENFKMDDKVYVSDNRGACTEISYIDKQEVYNRAIGRTTVSMTININNNIDFRK